MLTVPRLVLTLFSELAMLVMPDVALETELLTLVSDDARLVTPKRRLKPNC